VTCQDGRRWAATSSPGNSARNRNAGQIPVLTQVPGERYDQ
jgi:hypothetical protein